jgi:hypothetical protein
MGHLQGCIIKTYVGPSWIVDRRANGLQEKGISLIIFSKRSMVLWFFFTLCAGGVLVFLNGQGESAMKNKAGTINTSTPKPLIDAAAPSRIETATFALG